MIDLMFEISVGLMFLVSIKAVMVGSEFSFYSWFKYGKAYTHWYANRETFESYLRSKG